MKSKIKVIFLAVAILVLTNMPVCAEQDARKNVSALIAEVANDISGDQKETKKVVEKKVAPKVKKAVKKVEKEIDPCEAYKVSYEAYVVCQDRTKKIQRMIDARERRQERYKKKKNTKK